MAFARCVALAAVVASLLTGCGGGGKTMVPDDPDCSNDALSIGFNTPPGYTASMNFTTTSNCFAPATYSAHASQTVIGGPPFTDPSAPSDPTFKVWLYLSYQFDTLQYLTELPSVNVSVPPSIVVPGRTFHLAYDTNDTPPPFVWIPDPYGAPFMTGNAAFAFAPYNDTNRLSIEPNALYQVALWSTGP